MQGAPADLLFAFDSELDVDWQAALGFHQRLDAFDQRHQLTLVVGSAPRVDPSCADLGLEWR